MLRYLASGHKDLDVNPILVATRFNWEFYANLDGQLRPTLSSGRQQAFSGPKLWLFSPTTPHGWQAAGTVERAAFHFSSVPDLLQKICAKRGWLEIELNPDGVETVRRLAAGLENDYRKPTQLSLLVYQRALLELSLLLLQAHQFGTDVPLEAVAVERVERAVEWYVARLEDRPTFEALADVVNVSPVHLRRQFKLVYGRSPHFVLTQMRLEKAAQLLATTTEHLEAIARQSGFNSSSDFCRVFHRHFKVYPNTWRTFLCGMERAERHTQLERLIARSGRPGGHLSTKAAPFIEVEMPAEARTELKPAKRRRRFKPGAPQRNDREHESERA